MSLKNKIFYVLSNIPFVIIILVSSFIFLITSCSEDKAPPAEKQAVEVDPGKIVGKWLRPDGGYVIEILNVHDQGTLEAAYYNPQPINIAQAEWKIEDSRLRIYIKFDDVNYPGSTYTLDYFPDRDQLIGAYFQATQQQTYYVEFMRQPK